MGSCWGWGERRWEQKGNETTAHDNNRARAWVCVCACVCVCMCTRLCSCVILHVALICGHGPGRLSSVSLMLSFKWTPLTPYQPRSSYCCWRRLNFLYIPQHLPPPLPSLLLTLVSPSSVTSSWSLWGKCDANLRVVDNPVAGPDKISNNGGQRSCFNCFNCQIPVLT